MRDITGFHLTPLTLICYESKVHYGLKYWSKRAEKSQIYTLYCTAQLRSLSRKKEMQEKILRITRVMIRK